MNQRILIVDDSHTACRQLAQMISELPGFEVVGKAKNGADAIQQYQQLNPDIVCLDIVMPVMDGLQALRAILSIDSNAKVIIISSVGSLGSKAALAFRLGAKSVISKPLDKNQLFQVLQNL